MLPSHRVVYYLYERRHDVMMSLPGYMMSSPGYLMSSPGDVTQIC